MQNVYDRRKVFAGKSEHIWPSRASRSFCGYDVSNYSHKICNWKALKKGHLFPTDEASFGRLLFMPVPVIQVTGNRIIAPSAEITAIAEKRVAIAVLLLRGYSASLKALLAAANMSSRVRLPKPRLP